MKVLYLGVIHKRRPQEWEEGGEAKVDVHIKFLIHSKNVKLNVQSPAKYYVCHA